jgi:hypothetical protein
VSGKLGRFQRQDLKARLGSPQRVLEELGDGFARDRRRPLAD